MESATGPAWSWISLNLRGTVRLGEWAGLGAPPASTGFCFSLKTPIDPLSLFHALDWLSFPLLPPNTSHPMQELPSSDPDVGGGP